MATMNLDSPRYNQEHYWGRYQHFVEITDPRNLWVTDEELKQYRDWIQYVKQNKSLPPNVTEDRVYHAKTVLDATLHPDTQEKIPLPFRMSCFVPTNLLVTAAMLMPNPSTRMVVASQWANQSVNVAFNWANSNKTAVMSLNETAIAYAEAVVTSCGVALGMSAIAKQLKSPLLGRLVPFLAVASAGTANVFLMRQAELKEGIDVFLPSDPHHSLGKSKQAANDALWQVAASRVAIAFPVLTVPPLVMNRLEHRYKWARGLLGHGVHLTLIAGCLLTALPAAVALFPQRGKLSVDRLEPALQFHAGKATFVHFNKGL